MILPALTEAKSPYWRPIKYSLFPPLGLATLAAYCSPDDEIDLQDEHVEELNTNDAPDVVVIQVYITNAFRAYALAGHYRKKGAHVCLGGLHVSSLPEEAAAHADSLFIGPGEDIFPLFLEDFRKGSAKKNIQECKAKPGNHSSHPARFDQKKPLPGSQFHCSVPGLSTPLRLLL